MAIDMKYLKVFFMIVLKKLFLFSSTDASFHISVCFPVVQILVVSNYSLTKLLFQSLSLLSVHIINFLLCGANNV